jgi:glycosyltransferase involved in cell wall biosynthesis
MKTSGSKRVEKVALIIPAYNESAAIGRVIERLKEVFDPSGFEYQITVVDDGSRDATADIASRSGAHVIAHILNTGSGGATATGLSYAQQNDYAIAATLDGDGQHDEEDVLRGVELMRSGEADLLIGSRLIGGGDMSKTKRLGNKGLSFITFLLFGVSTTDSQSGLRIFSKRALNELKWKTSGFEFCSEMLWRAKQQKLSIKEYPIKSIYTAYSKSKGQNNWNAYNIIVSLIRQRIVEVFSE